MTDYLRPFQTQLIEQVLMALAEVSETGISKGILLIGDSGVGKTHAFDHLSKLFPRRTEGTQVISPAVRVSLKTLANASSISKSALMQLGRPVPPKRKMAADELEVVLHDAIRAQRTSLVLLEEFHNGLLAGAAAIRTQNRHFLKNLWNMHDPRSSMAWVSSSDGAKPWGVVVVVSATIELLKPLAEDKELKSRFSSVIEAPSLALFPTVLLDEFRRVLKTMLNRYGLSERASVNDRNFVARVFFATNGHLRNMNDLVQRGATLSRKADVAAPMSELLGIAFEQIGGGYAPDGQNPFNWSDDALHANVLKARLRQMPVSMGVS